MLKSAFQLFIFSTILSFVYTLASDLQGCNKAVCASLVSKCMLLKSCECNMQDKKNCACCKSCHRCLSKLYTECCACVGLCGQQKYNSQTDFLERASTIESLDNPLPDLFTLLTSEDDELGRWSAMTYPAYLDLLYFTPNKDEQFNQPKTAGPIINQIDPFKFLSGSALESFHRVQHGDRYYLIDSSSESSNCTVAYMSDCISLKKCKLSCQSMGASRYRWFHNAGCCQCIGSTCLDHGKSEAFCLRCPSEESLFKKPNKKKCKKSCGGKIKKNQKLNSSRKPPFWLKNEVKIKNYNDNSSDV